MKTENELKTEKNSDRTDRTLKTKHIDERTEQTIPKSKESAQAEPFPGLSSEDELIKYIFKLHNEGKPIRAIANMRLSVGGKIIKKWKIEEILKREKAEQKTAEDEKETQSVETIIIVDNQVGVKLISFAHGWREPTIFTGLIFMLF